MIRAKDGRLEFAGSTELAVRRIAKYLKISTDELVERMLTETQRQHLARIQKGLERT